MPIKKEIHNKALNERIIIVFLLAMSLLLFSCSEPGDPIQSLVPEEDHVIGIALIENRETQELLLNNTADDICEYQSKIDTISSFEKWLYNNGNQYAIINDGNGHNPNMYVSCNETHSSLKDYDHNGFTCIRSKDDDGTNKEIKILTGKECDLWLIYTKKDSPGSYYLKKDKKLSTDSGSYTFEQCYSAKISAKEYRHSIIITVKLT